MVRRAVRASGRVMIRSVAGNEGSEKAVRAQGGRIDTAPAASRPYPSLRRAAQRRVFEQQVGRVQRRRRHAELGSIVREQGLQLGHRLRRVDHAELGGHEAGLPDVGVGVLVGQRLGPEVAVAGQEAVDLGGVDPAQQVGVVGAVLLAARRGSSDPAVDGPDDRDAPLGVGDRSVRGGGQEPAGPVQPAPRVTAKPGVLAHPEHRHRMQRLQQQGADAADEHRGVGMDPPDGVGFGEPAGTWAEPDLLVRIVELRSGDPVPHGIGQALPGSCPAGRGAARFRVGGQATCREPTLPVWAVISFDFQRSLVDPEGFWATQAEAVDWYTAALGRPRCVAGPALPVVLRRCAEYLLQRARPARDPGPGRAAGVDLPLGHHRHPAHLHLRRAAGDGGAAGRGAARARRPARGPGGDLSADGAGGGDRDARLRPDRRGALGGLRRVRRRRTGRADRGRPAQGRSSRPPAGWRRAR